MIKQFLVVAMFAVSVQSAHAVAKPQVPAEYVTGPASKRTTCPLMQKGKNRTNPNAVTMAFLNDSEASAKSDHAARTY